MKQAFVIQKLNDNTFFTFADWSEAYFSSDITDGRKFTTSAEAENRLSEEKSIFPSQFNDLIFTITRIIYF